MPDRSYVAQNQAARERLRELVARLSDEDMARPLDGAWTVSAALCHLAFWDRLWLGKFDEWELLGRVTMTTPRVDPDALNCAMLPWWLEAAPAHVRREVVAAAEAIDRRVETVSDVVVEQILAVRPRTIARATHRNEHLDEIEAALGRRPE